MSLLDDAIKTAEMLLDLTANLKKHDYAAVNQVYDNIAGLEAKVDDAHRNLVRQICTGSFFGGIREDLLQLLEMIDSISDSAKGAAKTFHELQMQDNVVDYFFEEDVDSFLSACIKTASTLRDAIHALEKNKEEVISLCEIVEKEEDEADFIRYNIVAHLFKNEINAKSLDIILLKDFLDTADDIADYADDGSDILLILVAKGYS
jgi:predicted phosphate transport protein (TIGR00153 family)